MQDRRHEHPTWERAERTACVEGISAADRGRNHIPTDSSTAAEAASVVSVVSAIEIFGDVPDLVFVPAKVLLLRPYPHNIAKRFAIDCCRRITPVHLGCVTDDAMILVQLAPPVRIRQIG